MRITSTSARAALPLAAALLVSACAMAGGSGITEAICQELLDAGADVVTLGNHAFDQREALVFIDRQDRLVRPLNFPAGTPGRGSSVYKAANGADVLVVNALGRVFMTELDCPFRAIDAELNAGIIRSRAHATVGRPARASGGSRPARATGLRRRRRRACGPGLSGVPGRRR